jgi:hypothetical protein
MKKTWVLAAVCLSVLGLGIWAWQRGSSASEKPAAEESPLFTGKEARLKIRIHFPAAEKPGFAVEEPEIYSSASKSAQIKQALQRLFEGPKGEGAMPALPDTFKYRELFVTEKGLAVIDLDPASVAALPGGTSSEFVALYCMTRAVLDNFKEFRQVQFLIAGEYRESLGGHLDISKPLALEDF